ncbi:MAG: hypothetical protein K2P38_13075, partial [Lachnospiraceae bacterium]|nr:hypothetical protein [Lachnospiraceae bacterium]
QRAIQRNRRNPVFFKGYAVFTSKLEITTLAGYLSFVNSFFKYIFPDNNNPALQQRNRQGRIVTPDTCNHSALGIPLP